MEHRTTVDHICEVCHQPARNHRDPRNFSPRCCYGCPCGVTFADPSNDPEQYVAEGWNADHDLRWIEVGRLRFEEDKEGASAIIQETSGPTWLSATELAGLARHLASWFTDDPSDAIRQIETCATYVQVELERWNERARIDEEHPPYDKLTRALDALLAKCRHLREVGLFSDRPKKTSTSAELSSDLSLLRDTHAKLHPAYQAFCRQMRGRAYGAEPLNQAWAFFKQGWADGNGDGELTTNSKIEPPCALLVMCCECGEGVEAPLPTDRDAIARVLAQRGWFMSVLTPPGQGPEVPIVVGALCASCAPRVLPPEILKVAEERRQKMLAGTR